MPQQTPAQHADAAAEHIRALNHATQSPQADWEYPGDAYSVVANLSQLAMRLPQAVQQIRQHIETLNAEGHLRSDKDTLDTDVAATLGGLDDAQAAAEQLYAALDRAHQGLGPIAYKE